MPMLKFTAPPLPHYIISGPHTLLKGQKHPSRSNIQVFDLLVIKSGCLYMGEEQETFEVRKDHALILLPDRYHYATAACDVATDYYWLHFQTDGPWSLLQQQHMDPVTDENSRKPVSKFLTRTFDLYLPQFTLLDQPSKVFGMIEQLIALDQGLDSQQVRWQQQVVFQELLQHLYASMKAQGSNTSTHCAELAAAYLRQHYREEISAARLGEDTNFHPVYIARCMHRQFGCSPTEYLQRYRIEQSKLLLLQTDDSIARVAEEVGFNQGAYFTSCFTKLEGISPSKYRQRFRS
ncbi:helix-turn-helix domain-containing protein [Paenibacillus terrigena]|uniref:helix-turn-helix domain-containing protein n=1 Tax=Paenibacillus terrigena TaxID=369333 RepID=UPI0004773871|nr:helix-turn-helix domain-containing protein [Paenibacillus terrigena]